MCSPFQQIKTDLKVKVCRERGEGRGLGRMGRGRMSAMNFKTTLIHGVNNNLLTCAVIDLVLY